MSYILDKYNFGHSNYALLETVLEVGTQVEFLTKRALLLK